MWQIQFRLGKTTKFIYCCMLYRRRDLDNGIDYVCRYGKEMLYKRYKKHRYAIGRWKPAFFWHHCSVGGVWGEEESKSIPDITFYPQRCSLGLRKPFPKALWMQEPWYSPTDAKSCPCRWRWYKTHCKAKARFKSGQGRCISHGRY